MMGHCKRACTSTRVQSRVQVVACTPQRCANVLGRAVLLQPSLPKRFQKGDRTQPLPTYSPSKFGGIDTQSARRRDATRRVQCSAVPPAVIQEAAAAVFQKVTMYVGIAAITLVISYQIGHYARKDIRKQKSMVGPQRSKYFTWEAIIGFLEIPLRFIVPSAAALASAREIGRLLLLMKPELRIQFAPFITFLSRTVDGIQSMTLKYAEVAGIILVGFAVLSLKSLGRSHLCDMVSESQEIDRGDVKRALAPISALLDVVIVSTVILALVQTMGFNPRPLLGTFGVVGLMSGLASKSFAANIVSGIQLLLTRPFVPGDRIMVKGALNVHGIVEKIDFNRTYVRQDNLLPVIIPNGMLQDSVIINESRSGNSSIRNNYHGPRVLDFDFFVPYRYMDKVADITARLREWLINDCSLVDKRRIAEDYPAFVKDLDANTVRINVRVYSTTTGSRAFAAFREQVLINVFRIVRSCGATVTTYDVRTKFTYQVGQRQALSAVAASPWELIQPIDVGPVATIK